MKPTVVILLSDKRSGSTMLERELCRHSSIHHVEHTPHSYNETHHWLKAAVVLGMPPACFSGGKVYPGYGSRKNARAYLVEGIRANVPEFETPSDDRELVFRGWEALCGKYANPVFFEKSPQHLPNWGALTLMLEWARETAFDVKFIGLVRNPVSVLYSARELFGTNPNDRQFSWVGTQRNLLAFRQMLEEGRYHELRYEDLTADPSGEFGRICEFIGVGREEILGAEVHGKSLEKWKEDDTFQLNLDESVRQMAERFGYTAEELGHPDMAGDAPDRYKGRSLARVHWRDRFIRPMLLRLKGRSSR